MLSNTTKIHLLPTVQQTCCLETVSGSLRMTHDTVSLHGGVVSEPLYVRYRLENSGTSLDSENGSGSNLVVLAILTDGRNGTIRWRPVLLCSVSEIYITLRVFLVLPVCM